MILAVCGLKREARIVSGPGVRAVVGGGDAALLMRRLETAWTDAEGDIEGVISIGLAGGLSPSLRPGEVVVASKIVNGGGGFTTDAGWSRALMRALPHSVSGAVAGSDRMLTDAEAKATLHGTTGAVAVDMESHHAARFAQARRLPLAVVRAISDGAEQALPAAAQKGMRPDGGTDLAAVLAALMADPRQLPALIRTGIEAEKGFSALLRCNRLLGPQLGFRHLGHHLLDVV